MRGLSWRAMRLRAARKTSIAWFQWSRPAADGRTEQKGSCFQRSASPRTATGMRTCGHSRTQCCTSSSRHASSSTRPSSNDPPAVSALGASTTSGTGARGDSVSHRISCELDRGRTPPLVLLDAELLLLLVVVVPPPLLELMLVVPPLQESAKWRSSRV